MKKLLSVALLIMSAFLVNGEGFPTGFSPVKFGSSLSSAAGDLGLESIRVNSNPYAILSQGQTELVTDGFYWDDFAVRHMSLRFNNDRLNYIGVEIVGGIDVMEKIRSYLNTKYFRAKPSIEMIVWAFRENKSLIRLSSLGSIVPNTLLLEFSNQALESELRQFGK